MAERDRRLELLTRLVAELKESKRELAYSRDKIAIIGMGCRFPGEPGIAGFRALLWSGSDAVTRGRSDGLVVTPEAEEARAFGAYVAGMDLFDAEFFRIAPAEAEFMDPQQRVLLETSWEAIEDAGLDPDRLVGSRTGVFLGIGDSDYQRLLGGQMPNVYLVTGTSYAAAAGRVAFSMGFQGPAIATDTACSSSLVVLHQAAAALQRNEADLALVGGVSAVLSPGATDALGMGGMLAPDGRCKTFDAAADGFVRGEGCGVLVLKRLSEAERDGDRIHGVLLGSAVNQDGASAGLTVPNGPAQERVIAEALSRAGIEPSSVDYLEAHGTGTELGDPIEVQAAAAVYGNGRNVERPLWMGSVKTNIGHLEAAAGVAGVIKVLLAMREGVIPRHLHFETQNPRMDWERLPVRVTVEPTPWPSSSERPSRAAVSSFGVAGTNAHAILERYAPLGEPLGAPVEVAAPADAATGAARAARGSRLLPLSGRTARALSTLADRYLGWLDEGPEASSWERLSDAAWTAAVGRRHFAERAGIVFSDAAGLRDQLTALSARVRTASAEAQGTARPGSGRVGGKVAFLFTGQGSQWTGMGRHLYDREPVARSVFDRCESAFVEARGESLLEVLFARRGRAEELDRTEWAQPALYALECALVALWESVGIVPDAVLGHSVGEISAAYAAGIFGLDEGMRFAARRGALMGSLPREGEREGGMLAVFAPGPVVASALRRVSASTPRAPLGLAADNGSHQVVSGLVARLAALEERLTADGIRTARLATSHAFHSALMDPVLDDLEQAAPEPSAAPASALLVSNVTGRVAGSSEARDRGYWRRQARAPVLFADAVKTLAELGVGVLVEIGPRRVLGPMAALAWPEGGDLTLAPSVITSQDGATSDGDLAFLRAVSGAYEAGLSVAFESLFAGERRRRVSLPTYPFQRRRHWVEHLSPRSPGRGHPLLGVRHDLASGELMFEAELSTARAAWLRDCRAFGRAVAPAALYGAQALAAFRLRQPAAAWAWVEDVRIERPLVWTGRQAERGDAPAGRLVQVVLGRDEGSRGAAFAVFSRVVEEDSWVRHASGRVRAGRTGTDGGLLAAQFERLRSVLPPVAAADLYHRVAARGLRYGPSLWSLEEVQAAGGDAVGVARPPADLAGPGAGDGIHPVLLDAGFQLAAALEYPGPAEGRPANASGAAAWLPAGWESLWLRSQLPDSLGCRASAVAGSGRGEGPETRTADVTFFGRDGEVVGGVRGCMLRRMARAELVSASAGADDLLYEAEWRAPVAGGPDGRWSADFVASPREVAAAPRSMAEYLGPEEADPERFAALETGLETLARSYALAALERLGWERRPGAGVDAEPLRQELQVGEGFRRLLARLLTMLAEAGVLAAGAPDTEWRVEIGAGDSRSAAFGKPETLAKRLRDSFPEASVEVVLLERCGSALAEVLAGRAAGLPLLFSGEPNAADLYRDAPGYRAINQLVGDVTASLVSALPEGRRLRVLEVGAGTGGTTAAVLSKLPQDRTDYAYTDISASFFAEAKKRFRDSAPWLDYRVLDIERDPGEQGFDLHRYDLVLAANVLHATRDLGESLRNCRRLLAPSGVVVALEGTRPRGWSDLTFGLLPGWWRFDDAYRSRYALVGPAVWRRALLDAEYGEVGIIGMEGPEDAGAAPAAGSKLEDGGGTILILARGPSEVVPDPGLWVVWPGAGDADGMAGGMARELERYGQTVVRAGAGPYAMDARRTESWRDLFLRLPETVAFRGVVHLEALSGGAEPSAEDLSADLERVVSSAEALVGGLRDAGRSPAAGLWFVTRGGRVLDGGRQGELAGSALWGFGKVVGQEMGELAVRLVDLDPAAAAPAESLVQELLFPDRETEVAWRGGGRRVARLVRSPARVETPDDGGSRSGRDPKGAFPELGNGQAEEALRASAGRVAEPAPERGCFREDRSYLVTAELGALGLEVAAWLAERGAGGIVLQRGRFFDEAAADRLRARGAAVGVVEGDLTNLSAVAGMVSDSGGSGLPPIGGVVHGLGLTFGATADPDGDAERETWRAAIGGWNLHRATLDLDLDLFLLFSGFAGVVGCPGPPRRAAAGAFLVDLARRRRARGLPGQAIAWGPWSGDGAFEEFGGPVAEDGAGAEVSWITPQEGIRILSRVVRENLASVAAGAVDWGVFGETRPAPAFLSELTGPASGGSDAAEDDDLVARLRVAPGRDARERLMIGFIEQQVQNLLQLPSRPPPDVGFLDLGMDSLMAVELRNRIESAMAGAYRPPNTIVFDHPNILRLARHLLDELSDVEDAIEAPRRWAAPRVEGGPIAIVGLAVRAPGAADVAAFAERLATGKDSILPRRPEDPAGNGLREEDVPPAGYLEGIDRFDAGFFGIIAEEAKLMEPQQRLLLETSWHALEDAGIPPGSLDGSRTGVYAALGVGTREYADLIAVAPTGALGMHSITGSSASTAVGRISYTLGLEGPAISVDTSCSSSLVAVHQAVLDLERQDTDLALAGGANVILSAVSTRLLAQSGLLSARGRCSAFDASADGYVRGEGCGIVVLKRLADAEAAGDRILAVIRGSAVNQDGARTALSAPAGSGQRRVMEEALRRARLEPSEVDYLEAHGIGSPLGDPIEAHAASAVYGRARPRSRPLLLGSVKTNIGHLEASAGVVSVVKAVVAIRSRTIPPQLHFHRPNPQIAWDDASFRVVSEPTPWPRDLERPRRAAVSAFGVSGTNAHLILEEYGASVEHVEQVIGGSRAVAVRLPETVTPVAGAEKGFALRRERLLPLSAKSPGALRSVARSYLDLLDRAASGDAPLEPADLAWSAGVGRNHHSHRAGLVFEGVGDLRKQLEELAGRRTGRASRPPRKVAFVFGGEGAPPSGVGRLLYETEPAARAVLELCDNSLRDAGGPAFLNVFVGGGVASAPISASVGAAPALYALEAALVALWSSVGVSPALVCGSGVGALAGGYAAGVFGLEDGLRLAALRGLRNMLTPRTGWAMLVCGSSARIRSVVRAASSRPEQERVFGLALSPHRQVLFGTRLALDALEERLAAFGELFERRPARVAAIGELVREALSTVRLERPSAAVHRTLGGGPTRMGRLLDPAYWQRRVLERSSAEAASAWPADPEVDLCIEVGPSSSRGLSSAAEPDEAEPAKTFVSSPYGALPGGVTESDTGFSKSVARAYAAGADIRFDGLFASERRRRIPLPKYPFRRLRYWPAAARPQTAIVRDPLLGERHSSARKEVTFETELRLGDPAWLKDYRLFGKTLAPPGLFAAQLASAALREFASKTPIVVDDLCFREPLVLPGPTVGLGARRWVQIVVGAGNGAPGDGRTLGVFSREAADGDWVLHSEAVGLSEVELPPRGGPAAWDALAHGLDPLDASEFYRDLGASGIRYDWSFRVLSDLRTGAGEALAKARLRAAMRDEGIGVHPVLLEACFQSAVAATRSGSALRPAACDRLWLHGGLPREIVCHVRRRPAKDAGADQGLKACEVDLWVYAPSGVEIGGMRRLVLEPASGVAARPSRLLRTSSLLGPNREKKRTN